MPRFYFIALFFVVYSSACFAQEGIPPAYAPWQYENNADTFLERIEDRTSSATSVTPDKKNEITEYAEEEQVPSTLEKMYSKRITGKTLTQFGYNIFANSNTLPQGQSPAPMGAVQDNFILGSGDTLSVTFTGERTDQKTYKIDPRGTLAIKDFPPIPATGRTIAQLRDSINAHLSTRHNTQAYVSLSSVRQIGVLVVGHVKSPGRKQLSAFHTILDALTYAGGIQKDGSLRRIKLVRNGRSQIIDLYALLMHGAPHTDMRLRDGDRIIIPPIGPTIAIAGAVKRPGIYEIKKTARHTIDKTSQRSKKLNMNAMLDFAGGILTDGQNRFIRLALTKDGQETVTQINDPFAQIFGDGTILNVLKSDEKRKDMIELTGHTRTPGLHDLAQNKTLSTLLQNEQSLGDDIYPLIGVIERWDSEQLTTRFLSFPVRIVLKNEFDIEMQSNDRIILLSNKDISNIYTENNNETYKIKNKDKNTEYLDDKKTISSALKSFLKERSVSIRGAVRKPGLYPVAENITLDNLLAVAGGLTLDANRQNIEITSKIPGENRTERATVDLDTPDTRYTPISAGDAVRVNQKFRKIVDNTVYITGEILHPGKYDLSAGDKVSDLIARAGGMTEQAYPDGAIFSRESERRTEERRFRKASQNMQKRLASAIEHDEKPPNATQIEMVQNLADELATIEAVGRITVETNPDILATHPELDMLLEKGDRIYIPKRPLTVRVSGDVLSPANLQFRQDKKPLDYIHEAGGFTHYADKSRTFVLHPDGSAQPLKVSAWNHTPVFIPPGATIIVPRDPKPFDFIESAKEIGQILSNLAVTAVFIDDIRD